MVALRLLVGVVIALCSGIGGVQAQISEDLARLELVLDERAHPPLQREMVLATLRGTYSVEITLEKVIMPRMRNVEWLQIDHDNWRIASVNGRTVRIMERRLAFFPLEAGALTVRPALQELTILDPGTGQRSEVTISAKPVQLEVQEALAAAGDWWLPALALEITDEWSKDPAQLADGDSVIRTVTLTALGATEQMIPPQPAMRQPWLITFTDPEQRGLALSTAGPLAKTVWRWTLRPVTGEPGVIPEVVIPWYDTRTREVKTAVLKAQPFGYAGFGANTGQRWQSEFTGKLLAVGAFVLGLIAPVLLLSPRGRVRPLDELAAPLRRLLPRKELRNLRRAARRGDVPAMREAAYAVMADTPVRVREKLKPALQSLDRSLFGPDGPAPEPAAFVREFERLLRQERQA